MGLLLAVGKRLKHLKKEPHHKSPYHDLSFFFFLWRRTPQQTLWKHCNLKVSCPTLWCRSHFASVLKINQLMPHRKIIGFCFEIRSKHINKAELYYSLSSYCAVNTPRQGFENQSFNAVWGKKRGLFRDPYKPRKWSWIVLQAQILPRRKRSSLYLRLLTSSGGPWNSNVLIILLPSCGGPWNSKRHIDTRLTEFYIRLVCRCPVTRAG
jgi:hypothetical protein